VACMMTPEVRLNFTSTTSFVTLQGGVTRPVTFLAGIVT
jgi:hypothetical protein